MAQSKKADGAYGKIKQAEINFMKESTKKLTDNDFIEPEGGFLADGQINYCAENTNPDSQNGRYAIYMERPLTVIFWKKGQESVGYHTAKREKYMTNAERENFRTRIQKAEDEQKKECDKEEQSREEVAQQTYASYPEANNDHPYLKQKGISGFGLVKTDPATENIAIPVYSVDKDSIVNIQYLSLKPMDNGKTKRFQRFLFDEKAHGYFTIPATKGHETDPILIAEDFATGASLHEATEYETWITFSPSNLVRIAKHVASKRQNTGRIIVICGDYDAPSEKMRKEGGIGVYLAREAAEAIGCCLAISPPVGDRGYGDFNKAHPDHAYF